MRIVVIGGTHFIGPHVVRQLASRGHDVTILHRGADCADRSHIHRHRLDLPRDLHGDVVVDMWCMTEAHARAAAEHFRRERYVVMSSGDVYRQYDGLRGRLTTPPDPIPLAENAPLRERLYPYRGVLAGELWEEYDKILVERALAGDRTTILRLPAVYGPHDEQRRFDGWSGAVRMTPRRAQWRWTYGYVENVADAIVLAALDERAAGRTYNVGDPDAPTQAEWVRLFGGDLILDDAAADPPLDYRFHLVTDTARIRRELGYRERVTRAEAIESAAGQPR